MGYAAAPRVAFIVYGIQTFFTAIIIIIISVHPWYGSLPDVKVKMRKLT